MTNITSTNIVCLRNWRSALALTNYTWVGEFYRTLGQKRPNFMVFSTLTSCDCANYQQRQKWMRVNNYKHSPIQWHHNYFQVQSVVGKVDDHSEHVIRKRKKKAHHGAILFLVRYCSELSRHHYRKMKKMCYSLETSVTFNARKTTSWYICECEYINKSSVLL